MHEERVRNEYDRELNYFSGFQVKQMIDGIFVHQAKYIRELIKKFVLEDAKISKTHMAMTTKLGNDEHEKNVDI